MKNIFLLFVILCSDIQLFSQNIKIDTLLYENIGCRAISIQNDTVFYAGMKGKYGYIDLISKKNNQKSVEITNEKIEFRSIAQNKSHFFILNVGNPARLYKVVKKTLENELVYSETHEKVFYDALTFISDTEAFAVGDPIENYPCLIYTSNSGRNWTKIIPKTIPVLADGEAFFAASNSNIHFKEKSLFLVTGGKKSRLFVSKDKGFTWQIFETPIVQGQNMTGAFSADFYNDKIGIIAGGNYEKSNDSNNNMDITYTGGKTWNVIKNNNLFGYVSSVQFFPNNKNKIALATASGIFIGNIKKGNFVKIASYSDIYTIRFLNKSTIIAAGKDKILRIKI